MCSFLNVFSLAVPYDDSWNLRLLIKLFGGTTDVYVILAAQDALY